MCLSFGDIFNDLLRVSTLFSYSLFIYNYLAIIPFKELSLSCYTLLPTVLLLLEAWQESLFWYCMQLICSILHYVFPALIFDPFKRHIEGWGNASSHMVFINHSHVVFGQETLNQLGIVIRYILIMKLPTAYKSGHLCLILS